MPPILVYHSIEDYDEARPAGMDCPPELFARQLEFLASRYRIVPLDELFDDYLSRGRRQPSDMIVLTFDDGYLDNYTKAFPLLRERALPATVFCVTSYLGGAWPAADWDGEAKAMLHPEAMAEMQGSGISFGSHGHSHRPLDKLSDAEIRDELERSRLFFREAGLEEPRFISYPFGCFDGRVKEAVRDCGFDAAFTVWTPSPDRWSLNRLPLHRRDGTALLMVKLLFYDWYKKAGAGLAAIGKRFRRAGPTA